MHMSQASARTSLMRTSSVAALATPYRSPELVRVRS
jgi:hypothetical protein